MKGGASEAPRRMLMHRSANELGTPRRRQALLLSAAALTAGLVAACGAGAARDGEDGGSAEAIPTRIVRVVPVTLGERVDRVELSGELHGMEEVRVFPQLAERIVSLHVDEGQRVAQGALLATLRGDLMAEGERQARAGLDAAKASLDAVKDNVARTRRLASAGAVPPSQLEALESQQRAAEAQVRQLTAVLAQAATQKGNTQVRSPIAGVVTGVLLRAGDLATPGVPLLTVVRADKVKAVFRVAERDFLRLAPGMPVTIAPLARPDTSVTATLSLLAPVVDRNTRTGLVEVQLPNRDGRLLPGTAVRALVELERRSGVVLVPAEGVLLTSETDRTGIAGAFVAADGRAVRREVRVGARQGSDLEIVEGLRPGESLIVHGNAFLRDGNPIRIDTDGPGVLIDARPDLPSIEGLPAPGGAEKGTDQ